MDRNAEPQTIGTALERLFARAEAELQASRAVLGHRADSLPNDFSPLEAFEMHLIEALDAVIEASGVAGSYRKLIVLRAAAQRHGIEIFTASGKGENTMI
jgi:hypothetical protein